MTITRQNHSELTSSPKCPETSYQPERRSTVIGPAQHHSALEKGRR